MKALRNLPGPSLCEPEDTSVDEKEAIQTEVARLRQQRLTEIDNYESEQLESSDYESIFTALADFADSELLKFLADGNRMSDATARYCDVFARLDRIAKSLAKRREIALEREAIPNLQIEAAA